MNEGMNECIKFSWVASYRYTNLRILKTINISPTSTTNEKNISFRVTAQIKNLTSKTFKLSRFSMGKKINNFYAIKHMFRYALAKHFERWFCLKF